MIQFKKIDEGIIECTLDLNEVYTNEELEKFDERWTDFLASDNANTSVINRNGNIIIYLHKSWVPSKKDNRPSILMLFGNPAPHSVRDDIYFSYEGNGTEHRFWKVFRELGYININSNPKTMKQDFFNLQYESPFRLGLEVIYTFPSTASKPKWSGVAGLARLFGKKVMRIMLESEKKRILPLIENFVKDGGAVIALQKDAYNSVAQNYYDVKEAVNFNLKSTLNNLIKIYGTPPTRWLYTKKMKDLLKNIKKDILYK
jgi:hypothetical protein